MRVIIGMLLGAMVLGLAFWAYRENYTTRAAQAELRAMQREVGALQEELRMLRAEWGFLNRPERLRTLVALNFDRLGLMPMTPEHFGAIDQIAYPAREPILSALQDARDLDDAAAEANP
jgi:hypothetical protein